MCIFNPPSIRAPDGFTRLSRPQQTKTAFARAEQPVALRQRRDGYKPALNGNGNLYKIAHPNWRWITRMRTLEEALS
jgi:hypothetical protein